VELECGRSEKLPTDQKERLEEMATSMILQSLPVAITSLYLELNVLPKYLEHLLDNSTTGSGGAFLASFPKAYGGVIIVNVIFSGLYLVVLGMKVGGARKRFTDKVSPKPSLPHLTTCSSGNQRWGRKC
jgi:hypothetical protein